MMVSAPQLAKRRLGPRMSLSIDTLTSSANANATSAYNANAAATVANSPAGAASLLATGALHNASSTVKRDSPERSPRMMLQEQLSEFSTSNPYQRGPALIIKGPAGLYLGCAVTAANSHFIHSLKIRCIVNVAKEIDIGTTVAPMEGFTSTPNRPPSSPFPSFTGSRVSRQRLLSPHTSPVLSATMVLPVPINDDHLCTELLTFHQSPHQFEKSAGPSPSTSVSSTASTCILSSITDEQEGHPSSTSCRLATEIHSDGQSAASFTSALSFSSMGNSREQTLFDPFLPGLSLQPEMTFQEHFQKQRLSLQESPIHSHITTSQKFIKDYVCHHKFAWTHHQDLASSIDDAVNIIQQARDNGHAVLVHCQQGVSRSAALVIAYVMKSQRMCLQDAYTFVKQSAPQISPNVNLVAQLVEFEQKWNLSADSLHREKQ
ncbi:hypothetical protein BASA50_011313 [Batrachochytrium salamandrivorans]|uniref:protein-tyrosine-phosphatase n=1 Tax=Batrachochytrium salamandrivorans TaxID=1357716 RepID=A0ABQ8EWA2_9FUNG|nr:hypothetical protein BASA60_007838 [Batrachochytrium salamandrivorans]KAH6573444.1 hypothetical protein BASA62_002971 [Batrachochytrium salamandrivorans]KAH6587709.1 hypothetical protein BASA50_011313 [Batrachochytrium salamandrivorans]KAH6602246.1 hypothetical protein BASA61_001304 [Batrachochytrium salamandrivorans]KAH9274591.1 hypothetical protein BASA83_003227 [Batrachochytrium salamandrivorans]